MDHQDSFVPRAGIAQIGENILTFLDRYLTVISIAVALLSVAALLAGPIRSTLFPQGIARPSTSGTNVASGQAPININTGASINAHQLERNIVPFTIIPQRARNRVSSYVVQAGDTLMGIAEAFGLDRNTLFWSNENVLMGDVHMLQPGMELAILPEDGVMYTSDGMLTIQQIAEKHFVDPETIIESHYNEFPKGYTASMTPPWGMKIVIPGGTGSYNAEAWKPVIVQVADPKTGQSFPSFMPNMAGSCNRNTAGGGGTGTWINPVPSAALTQSYYAGHGGIDLGAPVGTPVLASDTGVVVYSGWVPTNWGYGQLVVLDHGNGWTTYYAHLSSINVGCGQMVGQGSALGAVGSTGNSSGPHLHFEMRWNHTQDNPANHVGF